MAEPLDLLRRAHELLGQYRDGGSPAQLLTADIGEFLETHAADPLVGATTEIKLADGYAPVTVTRVDLTWVYRCEVDGAHDWGGWVEPLTGEQVRSSMARSGASDA